MDLIEPPPFLPPVPRPQAAPLGTLALLRTLRRNVLEIWTEDDFRQPYQVRRTIVDHRTLVNDPDAIRHIFVDNARNYDKNELQLRLLRPALGTGLVTANGDTWRRQRQMLAPFFTPPRMKALVTAQAEVVAQSVARLEQIARADAGTGATLELGAEMGRLTLEILEHTLFGAGLVSLPSAFQQAVAHYLETLGQPALFDLLGLPGWLPRLNRIRGRKTLQLAQQVVDEMITTRQRMLDSGAAAPPDLMTQLLDARDAAGQGFSRREVHDNIITFIGAGHETTANALTWALYLLSQAPGWRARVEAEIDAHARAPADFTDLPVTRAVIEETLRLYPPIPMTSRVARERDVLPGVTIPAGSIVTVAPYVLHRHATLWDAPHAFDPERFLGENRARIARHAYLPFGAGSRICIGMGFAMNEMLVALRHLLARLRFDLLDGHPVAPQVRVSTRPQYGMKMRVTLRRGTAAPCATRQAGESKESSPPRAASA